MCPPEKTNSVGRLANIGVFAEPVRLKCRAWRNKTISQKMVGRFSNQRPTAVNRSYTPTQNQSFELGAAYLLLAKNNSRPIGAGRYRCGGDTSG
ncbi:hypothetical protein IMCC20628_00729 [Hoeflea sp. IMCC20628]|nr:hypothetical protein IMCC20628_00729 [Hoeflea sp. IMCC20628]